MPKDVRDLVNEANNYLRETANTFIDKNIEKYDHLTIEDDLLKIPNMMENEEESREYCHYSAVESDYTEPKNYREMLKRPEEEKRKWLEGVKKN